MTFGNLLVAVVWVASCLFLALYFRFSAEDAYITARYAENLVDWGALVYNRGEPISALTSPLHALFESLLYRVTGASLSSYKIVAVAFFLGGTLLVLRRLREDSPTRSLVAPVLLLSYCMIVWTVGGLETSLLGFLVILLVDLDRFSKRSASVRLPIMSLLAGLCFLTRFDSVLFTAPVVLSAALRTRSIPLMAWSILASLLLPVSWLIFATHYYGDPFPTSFYVKSPGWAGHHIHRNFIYTVENLTVIGWLPLCLFVLATARAKGVLRDTLAPRSHWGIHCGLFLILAYGLSMATHHMMFAFRHFVPYVPILGLTLADVADRLWDRLGHEPRRRYARQCLWVGSALITFQIAQLSYTYLRSLNGIVPLYGEYRRTGVAEYAGGFMTALELCAVDVQNHWRRRPDLPQRAPRIATFAGGALPHVYRDAYIYEALVSYRHNTEILMGNGLRVVGASRRVAGERPGTKTLSLLQSADYVHILTPHLGTPGSNLPKSVDAYELVANHRFRFEGDWQDMMVFYDPAPRRHTLSRRIDGGSHPSLER